MTRVSADADDYFQEVLIAHAAALLVRSCVTPRFGFQGGKTRIGLEGEFVVYVSPSAAENGAGAASVAV